MFWLAQVWGTHAPPSSPPSGGMKSVPQTLGFPPPPQKSGDMHVPHEVLSPVGDTATPPHPSATGPQLTLSCAHVFGTHDEAGDPHAAGVPPPPQVSPFGQDPQLSLPPHPLPAGPQVMLCSLHVSGRHAPPP